MSTDKTAPTPQGYGHDAKGAAGGKNVPDGGVAVTHTEPTGTVGGKGSGPQMIKFELDGQQVEARVGETIWQVAKSQGREIRICVIRPRRITGRTAIAAPAWSRSRASAYWPRPASARRASA